MSTDPNAPTVPASADDEPAQERADTGEGAAALRGELLPPGAGVHAMSSDGAEAPDGGVGAEGEQPVSEIESPGKIIRIGAMVKQLLEEVRNTELDERSRDQLRDIYENSIKELKGALSADLGAELEELSFDFSGEELPSGTELRLAKAQLVGWLEGLFHGIQATLMAQQMSARQQLEGMRAQLPEQTGAGHQGPGYL